jgi:hypothetical protein
MSDAIEQLDLTPPRPPVAARRRLEQLLGLRQATQQQHDQRTGEVAQIDGYLAIADAVEDALDKLSEQLFGGLVRTIEEKLTVALQEVLEQPIVLKVEREFKRGTATMSFQILREGQPEDIMRGQGGSVANILSVGLRLFALTTLDKEKHRRFLVLDEQDCWLRPDLVPRLVKIVHDAGKALGFQVLMISHHDVTAFEAYADRIYRFTPNADGVSVSAAYAAPGTQDVG